MIKTLKKLFGQAPSADYARLVKEGAIIVDVRTKAEYASGHITGSLNISVDTLGANLHKLPDKQSTIITCCASGVRSAAAASILKGKGYARVYDAGSWAALRSKV